MTGERDDGDDGLMTVDDLVVLLTESREYMLRRSIAILERVKPQREVHAGLEVLNAALAHLDNWAKGMAVQIERDTAMSLHEAQQH